MTHAIQDPAIDPAGEPTQLVPATPAPAPAPGGGFGVIPRSLEEAWRFAKMLAGSTMVPKAFLNSPENCMVAMQYGAEIGLPPMASLQSIAVINGKPGVYGDGFLGVIMSKPAYDGHEETYLVGGEERDFLVPADLLREDTLAVTRFWRKGRTKPFVGTFSVAEAMKAQLWKKEGPWSNYPARMLKMRARGFAGRDGFAAELRGVRMVEELRDAVDAEVEVVPPPPTPLRRSEKAALAAPAPAAAPVDDVAEIFGPNEGATAAAVSSQPAARSPEPVAPRPAAPAKKAPAAPGEPVTISSLVVTESVYVTPKSGEPHHEILATVQEKGKAPVGYTFVTRDAALAKTAASCEGSGELLTITWHAETWPDGSKKKVLDAIAAAN